jgi:Zn finger protein HypA/HybF involved in hydrogenase expression
VSIDIIEDNMPCDYCGTLIQFFDDDFVICPECGAEYWNMDYTGEHPGDRPDNLL